MNSVDTQMIYDSCTRFLVGHGPRRVRQELADLAESCDPDWQPDWAGTGPLIEGLETQIAELLGKEAAVFMPSGTMCQQIALRIWADRRGVRQVAFHPLSHLELYEYHAYRHMHGLHCVLVGSRFQLMTLDDLKRVAEPLGALLLELPQWGIGGQLPSWEELTEIIGWARERGIPIHLDGARLWECGPYYNCPYAEIAALFDSVYVSFYKGLGGIAGAVLAGPADFIATARIWQRRHGGHLARLYPYVVAARRALELRLPRMAAYHQHARQIATALAPLSQIQIVPNPPATNMMDLYLPGEHGRLEAAFLATARETKVWLGLPSELSLKPPLQASQVPGYQVIRLTVGDGTLELSPDEIVCLFSAIMERAA